MNTTENKNSEGFEVIPTFPKYETNGKIVRSVKSKNIMSLKKGTTKFYLENENKEMKLVGSADIKALFEKGAAATSKPAPVSVKLTPKGKDGKPIVKAAATAPAAKAPVKKAVAATKKVTATKKPAKAKAVKKDDTKPAKPVAKKAAPKAGSKAKNTPAASTKIYKCYQLHLAGKTNKEIATKLDVTPGNVSRNIWGLKSGRLHFTK